MEPYPSEMELNNYLLSDNNSIHELMKQILLYLSEDINNFLSDDFCTIFENLDDIDDEEEDGFVEEAQVKYLQTTGHKTIKRILNAIVRLDETLDILNALVDIQRRKL